MSKYRIELSDSNQAKWLKISGHGLAIVSIYCWQPDLIAQQSLVQVVIAIFLCGYLYYDVFKRRCNKGTLAQVMSIDLDGQWLLQLDTEPQLWHLSTKSKLSPFLLWIELNNNEKRKRFCVFHDQLKVRDYRRLARCILYRQYQHSNESK